MQPNQENNIPIRPVAARRPVAAQPASVAGAGASAPVDNEPTFGNGASVVGAKGGGKTGWILAIILLLLIAAGGVGFGVWAWMDGSNAKNSLNAQIADLQQQNNELQDELAYSGNTNINISTEGESVDTTDYIYVGEWGLKIKIPELLKGKISYIFTGESVEIIDESGFGVDSAVIRDGEYLKIFRSEVGEVDFENCEVSCTELFATIDGFDYSGAIIGSDLSGPDFEALKEMASAESFSAI